VQECIVPTVVCERLVRDRAQETDTPDFLRLLSEAAQRSSEMKYRNEKIAGMGSEEGAEFKLRTVDPERVRRTRALAERASQRVV